MGKTCYEVTHNRSTPCTAPNDVCPISQMLKTGKPITTEHIHYDSNCKPFYVEVSASPIKDKDGNITYAIHIAKDISERKRLENELLRFKLGVERAGEVVFLTNIDGTIVYVNPMFEKVYGYKKEEALGKTPRILKSGMLSQETYKHFWETLLANKIQAGEIINKTKDNRLLTIEGTSSPITDENGRMVGFLAIQRDITERKRMEEKLQQAQEKLQEYTKDLEHTIEERTKQLRDSERLATIGQIAGMVGHDIRNPLQNIVNELYFAKESMNKVHQSEIKQKALESVDIIQKQAYYINKIVSDLQDLAKPLKPMLVDVEICKLISETLTDLAIPSNIQSSLTCERIPKLKLDPIFMMRILTNLVNNAIQAMPNGGKLSLRVYRKSNSVLVTVEDTGVGIPEEVKSKLFTPLFTTKSKGQGFGLAAVKRMTEALGGTVSFESEVDKGTKFTMQLPLLPHNS